MLVILGVICIANPISTLLSMAWVIGLFAFLSGISSLIFSLRTRKELPNAGMMIFRSLLMLAIGILFLSDIKALAAALPFAFSFWILVEGLSLSVQSFDFRSTGFSYWWLILCLGLCSIALGIMSFYNPVATGITISTLLGLAIISNGINRFVLLSGIKRIEKFFKQHR